MGPATQAMQAIITNQPVGEGMIDAISKGETEVIDQDLLQALGDGFEFLGMNAVMQQNLYMQTTKQMVVKWYMDEHSSLYSCSREELLKYFTDMCTIIEKILIAVDKGGDENHKQALLHGRGVQNRPSTDQNDKVKDQHWNGPP
jgi:hypothetical protein